MSFGQDDARALTLAGFSIGMDGHDRGGAFTAFELALALSPSCALTYILGSVLVAWGGAAERAIDWSERGMRLSPLDPWAFAGNSQASIVRRRLPPRWPRRSVRPDCRNEAAILRNGQDLGGVCEGKASRNDFPKREMNWRVDN